MALDEMVDVFHPTKGRRRWPVTVWEKLTKDSDGTTRGGGWRVISKEGDTPEGEITVTAKVSAAPVVKKKPDVVAAPVSEPKVEEPEAEVTDPNGEAEPVVTEPEAKIPDPATTPKPEKPKRVRPSRKKK